MDIYHHQDKNIRKTWLLMFFFLVLVVAIGWLASFYFESPAILYLAVIFAVLMNFFGYWYSDKLVIKLTHAKPALRENYQGLWNVLENLSITSGLPMPKLYVIDDPAPNAFATGRSPKHSAVAVTTGLLKILNRTELEGVIAHELSHIGNRDMLLSTVAVVLVGFIAILSDFFYRTSFRGGRRDHKGGGVLLVLAVVAIVLAPIAARLIHFAISRKREFLADASGAMLTRYPEGLASALDKISMFRMPMQRASHATAHLFISNPFGAQSLSGFINRIFSTHPPIEDRVKALREKV